MKALVPTGDSAAMVKFAEIEEPVPAPNEVVIAVEAFSINRGETFLLEAPRPGWRPGKDVAGRVVTSAPDGSGPRVGTAVVAHPDGNGWAERVAVASDRIVELPAGVSAVCAAALPLAGITALRLLRQAGALIGKRILITGASGGVGHYVSELAVATGASVTALVRTPERGEVLARFGATVVTDLDNAVGTFDVVMESVGGSLFSDSLLRLRPGGLMLWFGQASKSAGTMPFFDVLYGPIELIVKHFSYVGDGSGLGEDLRILVDLVAGGRLHPEIGVVAPWEEAAVQIHALRERNVRGNVVLTV